MFRISKISLHLKIAIEPQRTPQHSASDSRRIRSRLCLVLVAQAQVARRLHADGQIARITMLICENDSRAPIPVGGHVLHAFANPMDESAHRRRQMPVLRINDGQRNWRGLVLLKDLDQAAGTQVLYSKKVGNAYQPKPLKTASHIGIGIVYRETSFDTNFALFFIHDKAPILRPACEPGMKFDHLVLRQILQRVRGAVLL